MNFFVSRHQGAIEWARKNDIISGEAAIVSHFDPSDVKEDDVVIGTLPIHLASEVCARGGKYYHLMMNVPTEARGKELTFEDMESFGAKVQEFKIEAVWS